MITMWIAVIYGNDGKPAKSDQYFSKQAAITAMSKSYRDHGCDVRISDIRDTVEIFVDSLLTVQIVSMVGESRTFINMSNI